MNIEGYETTTRRVKVEVEPMQMVAALKAIIFEKLKLPVDAQIDLKGRIIEEVEQHGSHSWFETHVVAEKPTKDQLYAIQTFSDLYDLVQKATAKNRS